MRLRNISWRNIKSFGNKMQTLDFSEEGGLVMVTGKNGFGKCLSGDTIVEVEIEDSVLRKDFLKFLNKL